LPLRAYGVRIRGSKADNLEAAIKAYQAALTCNPRFTRKLHKLNAAINFCREGDVLVCTKLDRLARSVADVVTIEARLNKKGASLLVMDPAMDTNSPAGRLVFNVLASIAQFEREIMLTRQREGIAKAKGEGKYKGRKPTARAKSKEVLELLDKGVGATEVAKRLGIGRRSA
jgi:DNA invertase Pin-like site-specific DNA recombinase